MQRALTRGHRPVSRTYRRLAWVALCLQSVTGVTAAAAPADIEKADREAMAELHAQMQSPTPVPPKEYLVSKYGSAGYAFSTMSSAVYKFQLHMDLLHAQQAEAGMPQLTKAALTDPVQRMHLHGQLGSVQRIVADTDQLLRDFVSDIDAQIRDSHMDDADKQAFLREFDAGWPDRQARLDKFTTAVIAVFKLEDQIVMLAEQDQPTLIDDRVTFHSDEVLAQVQAYTQQLKEAQEHVKEVKAEADSSAPSSAASTPAPAAASAR